MQQSELDAREQSSQFTDKMAGIDPSFQGDFQKQQQSDSVSIYELEQMQLIERFKHMLAGEVFNPKTGEWDVNSNIASPMNEKGVHHFMVKFSGHLDKNITLSDIDIVKLNEMMVEINNDILEIFWKRGTEFEIKRENMNFIQHIIEHHIYANYRRALDGGERIHRETLIKSVESRVDRQMMPRPTTSFGFMNPFKKRQEIVR